MSKYGVLCKQTRGLKRILVDGAGSLRPLISFLINHCLHVHGGCIYVYMCVCMSLCCARPDMQPRL